MPDPISIAAEHETFYVPSFDVKLEGRSLPNETLRDVMQATYTDNVGEIDSFYLKVNNWDGHRRRFKYEPPAEERFKGIFDPGKKLELWMGYMGKMRLMLTGEITTLEPDYPESEKPTLEVRGLNVLHRFRTVQHTKGWERKRDSDIAHEMGQQPLSADRPGLGIEVRINPADDETAETFVLMDNQYDIVFLLERARRHGYEVVLQTEERNGRPHEFISFGPPQDRSSGVAYRLAWGQSLTRFKPTLSTARQIGTVIVRGWDRRGHRLIEGTAKFEELVPAGQERERMRKIAQAFGNRTEIITDRPVHTRGEARTLARDILRRQLGMMVQATGETVGLPKLRGGGKVQIANFGERFDGEYFVTSTTHVIGETGYRTEFTARRQLSQPPRSNGARPT